MHHVTVCECDVNLRIQDLLVQVLKSEKKKNAKGRH
jgi:hypothetical protein